MNKNTAIIVAVVLIIIAAAGGFYAGLTYQKSQSRSSYAGRFAGGYGQSLGQNANLGSVRGQVLDMNNNTLTVKLSDGSTKIVILSGSTSFVKSATASLGDLKVGDTVNAIGTTNSDGSVTAQNVQINPTIQMRPGGAQQAPTGGTGQ